MRGIDLALKSFLAKAIIPLKNVTASAMKPNFIHMIDLFRIVCFADCSSPLKSSNRLTRLEISEKVSSQDDLLFIAMNSGLDVGA